MILIAFVRALGTYVFIVPNGFAPGGVSGIASILYNVVLQFNEKLAISVFNPAVTVFVMNVPLIIWAFVGLDKKFAFNTFFVVTVFSVFMALFSAFDFPVFKGSTYESGIMLLASIAGGAIFGVCLGLMLKINTSLGGTDILGQLIYKKNPALDVPWIIFLCDCVIVLFSGVLGLFDISNSGTVDIIVKILSPMLYSFISLFVCSKVAEVIQTGFESSMVFNIITDKPHELSERIVSQIHRGATIIRGEGVFTRQERNLVICVVRKKQYPGLKKLIFEVDPNAFMYITNTREVNGFGFSYFQKKQ